MKGFRDMIDGTMASDAGISAARAASGNDLDVRLARDICTKLCSTQGLDGHAVSAPVVGRGR